MSWIINALFHGNTFGHNFKYTHTSDARYYICTNCDSILNVTIHNSVRNSLKPKRGVFRLSINEHSANHWFRKQLTKIGVVEVWSDKYYHKDPPSCDEYIMKMVLNNA